MDKKLKNKLLIKRIVAYLIDLVVVSVITMLISKVTIINPYNDQYAKSQEKYQQMIQENKDPAEVVKSQEYQDLSYDISKFGAVYTIIDGLVLVGYFVIFQRATKGQTVGKCLMRIKVVSRDDKVVSIKQLLLRTLVIYRYVVYIVCGVLVFFASKDFYLVFNNYFSLAFTVASYAAILMIIFKEDGCGLHDLLARTKVVFVDNVLEEAKGEEKKEDVKELKEEKKTKNTKNKTKVVDAKYKEKTKKGQK